jgi:hypothetical protein
LMIFPSRPWIRVLTTHFHTIFHSVGDIPHDIFLNPFISYSEYSIALW